MRKKPSMEMGPDDRGLFWPLRSVSTADSHPMEAPYEALRKIIFFA